MTLKSCTFTTPIALLAGTLALVACDKNPNDPLVPPGQTKQPLDAAAVKAFATTNVEAHAAGIMGTLERMETTEGALEELFQLICSAEGGTSPDPQPPEGPPCGFGISASELEEISDVIDSRIFASEMIEAATDDEITYRLDGGVCGDEQDCQRILTEHVVRLTVTSPSAGDLDVALRVNDQQPAALAVYQNRFALTVDLGALRALAATILPTFDEDFDTEMLPDISQGRLTVALIRHAASDYAAEIYVDSAIAVASTGELAYSARIAASTAPVAAVRFDGDNLNASVALGNIIAEAPASWLDLNEVECAFSPDTGEEACSGATRAPHGRLALDLAGVTAAAAITDFESPWTIEQISLGDHTSRITLDGQDLVAVDLNALVGRTIDLTVTPAGDTVEVSVTPELQLSTLVALSPLMDLFELPAWTAGPDQLTASFSGAAQPSLVVAPAEDVLARITEGVLTLGSSVVAPVTASAGECLLVGGDENDHPLLNLANGTCP